jgi:hypothetical protein
MPNAMFTTDGAQQRQYNHINGSRELKVALTSGNNRGKYFTSHTLRETVNAGGQSLSSNYVAARMASFYKDGLVKRKLVRSPVNKGPAKVWAFAWKKNAPVSVKSAIFRVGTNPAATYVRDNNVTITPDATN